MCIWNWPGNYKALLLVHTLLHTEPAAKMPFHNMSHADLQTAALKSYRKDQVCF